MTSRDAEIKSGWTAADSLAELAQLTRTAGAQIVGNIIQRLPAPSKALYLGKGKLAELVSLKGSTGYNTVIFDDELTPTQQRNLEDSLQVKVIDRSALILDIFARRALTREGKLQVELAQHQYLLPRLVGQWSHLERLGGGIGTRGPGESQLETDRRLINHKIRRLKAQLEEVKRHRALYQQRRKKSQIPVIALVGYTNTGKSTLFNAFSQSSVLVENKLFATLDPTTRRLTLPDNSTVLLTDTVGFIRKLPATLATAFKATLEELDEADLLLHVVDISSHNTQEQCNTVEDTLTELGLIDKPIITAINKIDILLDADKEWTERTAVRNVSQNTTITAFATTNNPVYISAVKKWGLTRLMTRIKHVLSPRIAK